ncbi:hypothetical protein MN116_004941 [Schistosoma mekongi]|uniref:Uncharacterized protein n=1 Tax=Schistosoma mekongi TaxID=38744 RepID=A0AAE2D638_SCHME|nr:hypothetical protein MN116_004941 [Schistosoma mekongi]
MVSRVFNIYLTVFILWTINIMNIESSTYMAPIHLDKSGVMYIDLGKVNVSLSSDFTVTISDKDCTKTLSLRPPTTEEKFFKYGYRTASMLCKSWFLLRQLY